MKRVVIQVTKAAGILLICGTLAQAEPTGESAKTSGGLPPPSKQTGLTFETHIKPIFEGACFKCHDDEKQEGELRLNSLENLLQGGEDGNVVEPGDSAKSPLVIAVARIKPKKAMPPEHKPGKDVGPDGKKLPPVKKLSAEQVGLIRAWIDQGAK